MMDARPTLASPVQRTLSVLLVSYNTRHLLDECLDKLRCALEQARKPTARAFWWWTTPRAMIRWPICAPTIRMSS